MRDLAGCAIAVARGRDVDDGILEQAQPGGGEAAGVGAGKRVGAGEAPVSPSPRR
jgi:hypothetical protein